jgi:hypothetical protein
MINKKVDEFICEGCGHRYSTAEAALECEKIHKKKKAFDNIKIFELKQEHIDLLSETYLDWDNCEYGAPCINCKRPYGNSDVENDIAEIIKLPKKGNWDKEEEMWNDEAREKLYDLHKETEIALQIILHCKTFKLGKYKKKDDYGQEWEELK